MAGILISWRQRLVALDGFSASKNSQVFARLNLKLVNVLVINLIAWFLYLKQKMTGIHFKRINSTFKVGCNDFCKIFLDKKILKLKKTKVKIGF